ncbi:MAG: hypothetical protein Kow0090_19270 [Myxococcota bacterium]
MIGNRFYIALFIAITLAFGGKSFGQNISFTAVISPDNIEEGGYGRYALTLSAGRGDDIGEPELAPTPAGVKFVGTPSVSTQMSFSFGSGSGAQFSQTKEWAINFLAEKRGSYTISPAIIEVNGKKYKSNSVKVTVLPPGSPPPVSKAPPPRSSQPPTPFDDPFGGDPFEEFFGGGKTPKGDVFLQGTVTKTEVYKNENIIYSLYLYTAEPVTGYKIISLPSYDGFWQEQIAVPSRPQGRQVPIEGRSYTAYLIYRIALFPIREGNLTIPSIPAEVQVSSGRSFFGGGRNFRRNSQPIEISVLPLPEAGKPKNFDDMHTGQFDIALIVGDKNIKRGKPFSLSLTLKGTGNLKNIRMPKLPRVEGLKYYEPTEKSEASFDGRFYLGTKTAEYLVLPQKEGVFTIPPVTFDYFDPGEKAYKQAATDAVTIEVQYSEDKDTELAGVEGKLGGLELAPIRYELPPQKTLSPLPVLPERLSRLMALPPLFALLLWIFAPIFRNLYSSPERKLKRMQRERLTSALKAAKEAARRNDAGSFGRAAEEVIYETLRAATGLSARGMVVEELEKSLKERGFDDDVVKRILAEKETYYALRYASTGSDGWKREESVKELTELYRAILRSGRGGREKNKRSEAVSYLLAFLIVISIGERAFGEITRGEAEKLFDEANKAYLEKRLPNAMELYRRLQDSGWDNPAVMHNLGTTYLAAEEYGRAIWQLERAAFYGNAPDIEKNLKVAKDIVSSASGEAKYFGEIPLWRFVGKIRQLGATLYLFAGFYLAFFLLAGFLAFQIEGGRRWIKIALAVLTPLVLATAIELYGEHYYFVVSEPVFVLLDAPLKEGPAEEFKTALVVRGGTEGLLVKSHEEWRKLRFANGLTGWVKASAVGEVAIK